MGKTGMELITQERKEQIEKHGWSLEHDKDYGNAQLIQAAYFCIKQVNNREADVKEESWTWPVGWDPYFENKIRNKSIVDQCVVAGAFFMAENDRLGSDTFCLNHIRSMAQKIDMFLSNKKKIKVLTLSKVFLKGHPKEGRDTFFDESIKEDHVRNPILTDSRKIHTIRNTSDWPIIMRKINSGEMVLSIRQWSGIPYRSKHEKPLIKLNHIGIQKITIANRVSEYQCYVDGLLTDIRTIANNDGLSKQDFIDWFKPYFGKGEMLWNGVIIHFTPFRYNSES